MRFGSLFSGIGGFDLGLERAGMECAWQCEIDAKCRELLTRRFPGAVIYDDVTTLGGDIERVDLICGGFPCQDLSVAGKRAGLAGKRSGLFYEFMRIADELAPRWLLIENVPGLLSSNAGRDMGAVLGTLGELGYGWAYRILDAQYFGVAQRRRRVFIVGCLGGGRRAAEVLFEPESCSGDSAPSRIKGAGVAATLAGGSGERDWNVSAESAAGNHLVPSVSLSLMAKPNDSQDPTMQTYVSHTLTAEGHDASEDGTGRGTPLIAASLRVGNSRLVDDNVVGVLATAVRRLTPLECERLQGFPDGWTDGQSDSTRYKQLGNAVCVPVAAWIGKRIMEVAE